MVDIFWVTLKAHLGGRPRGAAGYTLFFGQNKPEGPQKVFLKPGPFLLNRIRTSGSPTYLESRCVAEGALHLACERDVFPVVASLQAERQRKWVPQ